jgi:hypothetical protein
MFCRIAGQLQEAQSVTYKTGFYGADYSKERGPSGLPKKITKYHIFILILSVYLRNIHFSIYLCCDQFLKI